MDEEFGASESLNRLMLGLNNLSDVEKVEIVLRDILATLIKSDDDPKPFTDLVPELIRHYLLIPKSKWNMSAENYIKGH